MVEGRDDVEAVAAAEVPGLLVAWFVVDDDAISRSPNEGGVVVGRAIEVAPGGHIGSEGGLEEEVESEFGLREKFYQRYLGKAALMPERVYSKWALKLWIDCLSALRQWMSGGTSWYSTLQYYSITRQNSLLTSFLSTWCSTVWTRFLRQVMIRL